MLSNMTIKHHNHRVHPCDRVQKMDLLKYLLEKYADYSIAVVAAQDISSLDLSAENLSLLSDTELHNNDENRYDVIISIDLAQTPEAYIERLGFAVQYALLIADEADLQELYRVETLMKRTIKPEIIGAFEPAASKQAKEDAIALKLRRERNKARQEERDATEQTAKPEHWKKDAKKGKPRTSSKRAPRVIRLDKKKTP